MKAIIIVLLLCILGLIGYNVYSNWKRFNPSNYEYVSNETINANHPNKTLLLEYNKAVEQLNGHVITQHTANNIDVRNPSDDDKTTLAAVSKYNDLLGIVRYYETQLSAPQETQIPVSEAQKKKGIVRAMFQANPQANSFSLGQKSALVFEIQKILNSKGDSINVDGVYSTETKNALAAFETKNGLFSDGKLDAMTLDYLLR